MNAADAKKVLIVDDEATNLRLLSRWLIIQGYDLETAANGEEAVAKSRLWRPDRDGRTKPGHFDPAVLQAFVNIASQFEELFERYQ